MPIDTSKRTSDRLLVTIVLLSWLAELKHGDRESRELRIVT
jgi:hypothetical protein